MVRPAAERREDARPQGSAGVSTIGFAQTLPTASRSNEFAREMIAGPRQHLQPAGGEFLSRQAAIRSAAAETAAQVFLGIRLQCAKCHNHPFERWTQDDYYDWAGFFARVEYKIIDERPRRQATTSTSSTASRSSGWPTKETSRIRAPEQPAEAHACSGSKRSSAESAVGGREDDRLETRPLDHRSAQNPLLRPRAGQPHLVSPAGPRDRRADRRFPRDQPPRESAAARCAGRGFRRARVRPAAR